MPIGFELDTREFRSGFLVVVVDVNEFNRFVKIKLVLSTRLSHVETEASFGAGT